jgi:hypothetical protein
MFSAHPEVTYETGDLDGSALAGTGGFDSLNCVYLHRDPHTVWGVLAKTAMPMQLLMVRPRVGDSL